MITLKLSKEEVEALRVWLNKIPGVTTNTLVNKVSGKFDIKGHFVEATAAYVDGVLEVKLDKWPFWIKESVMEKMLDEVLTGDSENAGEPNDSQSEQENLN